MTECQFRTKDSNDFACQQASQINTYEKVKQQRKKMEQLKKIIQDYRDRIEVLTKKVQSVQFELMQERKIKKLNPIYDGSKKDSLLIFELQKKEQIITEQQYIISSLKNQILTAYQIRESRQGETSQIHRQYQNLLIHYNNLKDAFSLNQRENYKLCSLLKSESFYQPKQQKNQQNSHQVQRLLDKKTEKYGRLKQQFKKQVELIEKYKSNEERHLQLISMLKKQKQKICVCHFRGKNRQSKKKILNNLSVHNL